MDALAIVNSVAMSGYVISATQQLSNPGLLLILRERTLRLNGVG